MTTQTAGTASNQAAPQIVVSNPPDFWKNTPAKYRTLRVVGIALALLLCAFGVNYYLYLAHLSKTIAKDTVPSIVAAEKLRMQLADANAAVANIFLTKEKDPDGAYWKAYKHAISSAQQSYLDAAQNITFGAAESRPIYQVMTGLNEFERDIGAARERGQYGPEVEDAERIMEERIIPATISLDKANYNELAYTYNEFTDSINPSSVGVLFVTLMMAGYLLFAQEIVAKKTNRRFNKGLVVSTVMLAAGVTTYMLAAHIGKADLKTAKEDAFDSVHAMWRAKATAYEANTDESLFLLESGNADNQARLTKTFTTRAKLIEHQGASNPVKVKQGLPDLGGYIGDELLNVTFDGEFAPAHKAQTSWDAYLAVDTKIRQLEQAGRHAEAVTLCLETGVGGSNAAFYAFDEAVDKTLAINQNEFGDWTHKANISLTFMLVACLVSVAAMIAGIFFGFKARLDEYHF